MRAASAAATTVAGVTGVVGFASAAADAAVSNSKCEAQSRIHEFNVNVRANRSI